MAICSLALVAAGACGDDEVAAPGVSGPVGPVHVDIMSVAATGGDPVSGETVDVTLGCDNRVHVRVELGNWRLRPPSACEGAKQCGWLVLRVDPAGNAQALAQPSAVCTRAIERGACASALITANLKELTPLEGEHELRVELRYSDGSQVRSEGGVLSDQVRVRLIPAAGCDPADAAPDQGDAGEEAGDADADPGDSGAPDSPDASDAADGAVAPDAPTEGAVDAAADAPDEANDAANE